MRSLNLFERDASRLKARILTLIFWGCSNIRQIVQNACHERTLIGTNVLISYIPFPYSEMYFQPDVTATQARLYWAVPIPYSSLSYLNVP